MSLIVRAKISTQLLRFCPRPSCAVAVYIDRGDGADCPGCHTIGVRASLAIDVVNGERIPRAERGEV